MSWAQEWIVSVCGKDWCTTGPALVTDPQTHRPTDLPLTLPGRSGPCTTETDGKRRLSTGEDLELQVTVGHGDVGREGRGASTVRGPPARSGDGPLVRLPGPWGGHKDRDREESTVVEINGAEVGGAGDASTSRGTRPRPGERTRAS